MKKIYLALFALAISAAAIAQTVTIGTSTALPPAGGSTNTFRSPWSPTWGYSYTQTIYLQSEINVAGSIASLVFSYGGSSLSNSDQIKVWMGTITRGAFASTADWEPISNLTQVFNGTPVYGALPGPVTINLTTPFVYNNTQNLIIAIHENKPDFNNGAYFNASEMGTARTIYKVSDDTDPDPANPGTGDAIRTKVGNVQIVFGAAQPVTLSHFTGEKLKTSNKLTWITQSEQNNKGFELQRSADGTSFTAIDFINSKAQSGSSNSSLTYSINDNKVLRGNNYYRLKQVDFDGKATYSKIVTLKGLLTKFDVSAIYPNPVKNNLSIILSSPGNDKATVFITDVTGKVVYQTTSGVIAGDNRIQVNASTFANGIYTVKAVYATGGESVVSKFVKQ